MIQQAEADFKELLVIPEPRSFEPDFSDLRSVLGVLLPATVHVPVGYPHNPQQRNLIRYREHVVNRVSKVLLGLFPLHLELENLSSLPDHLVRFLLDPPQLLPGRLPPSLHRQPPAFAAHEYRRSPPRPENSLHRPLSHM